MKRGTHRMDKYGSQEIQYWWQEQVLRLSECFPQPSGKERVQTTQKNVKELFSNSFFVCLCHILINQVNKTPWITSEAKEKSATQLA